MEDRASPSPSKVPSNNQSLEPPCHMAQHYYQFRADKICGAQTIPWMTSLQPDLVRLRKLEKAVAVRNSLLEEFSGKFRRCWKIIRRFSGSTKCYPCQGLGIFRQGKWLLENRPRLRERCWIFSSETATAFLSSSDRWVFRPTFHAKSLNPIFGDKKWFSPDSGRLSIHVDRCSVIFKVENNSDHPHPPYWQKRCPENMPYNGGLYGIKVGSNQGISTEIRHTDPKTMAYKPPLLRHMNRFYWGWGWSFIC